MKLFFKIFLGILLAVILIGGGISYWAYSKLSSFEKLSLKDGSSLTEKVTQADLWLQRLNKADKFNGAILLIKNDSILMRNVYGYTDHTKTQQLSTKSSFRLASLSKQFTAVAILFLKEKGKLTLDDPITKYLPGLPLSKVTIRNLLNHTSGIKDVYMDFPNKYPEEVGEVLTISKVISLLEKEQEIVEFPANEKYEYNNTGYVLLAGIVEAITKVSFEEFMKVELFDKLQMNNTRVWNLVSKDADFEHKTSSFENLLGEIKPLPPTVLDGVAGDGSVFSSIDDFVIWNKFWNDNELLSKQTMQEVFKKPVLNDGKLSDYGFGWVVTNEFVHSHTGSWLGARTYIIRNTKLNNCLVLLDNSCNFNLNEIAKEITKVIR